MEKWQAERNRFWVLCLGRCLDSVIFYKKQYENDGLYVIIIPIWDLPVHEPCGAVIFCSGNNVDDP